MTRTLKILGHTYTIVHNGASDFIGAYGRHHPEKLVIQIADDLAQGQAVSTILHEILHALDFLMKLGLDDNQVQRLESGLYQALTDNGVDLSPLWPTEPRVLKLMREQYE